MRLNELLGGDGLAVQGMSQPQDLEIHGLTADSRAVERGFLFAALPGSKVDGRNFIDQAVTRELLPRGHGFLDAVDEVERGGIPALGRRPVRHDHDVVDPAETRGVLAATIRRARRAG